MIHDHVNPVGRTSSVVLPNFPRAGLGSVALLESSDYSSRRHDPLAHIRSVYFVKKLAPSQAWRGLPKPWLIVEGPLWPNHDPSCDLDAGVCTRASSAQHVQAYPRTCTPHATFQVPYFAGTRVSVSPHVWTCVCNVCNASCRQGPVPGGGSG